MDVFRELLQYIIVIIIGIILINWYERKNGWENRFRTSLFFVLCWRTAIFCIVIAMNLIFELFLLEFFSNIYYYIFYPFFLVIVTLLVNVILGVNIFKFVYNKKTQESLVIIVIIVIIEIIIESFLLYTILIPESLIWNFNL